MVSAPIGIAQRKHQIARFYDKPQYTISCGWKSLNT